MWRMPNSIPASTVRRNARVPARWPAAAGSPRRRAQRPFPSMMIATVSATSGRSPSGSGRTRPRVQMRLISFTAPLAISVQPKWPLDLHDVGLFALQEVLDLGHVLVGELLHARLGRTLLVVADLPVLDELLEVPQDVAPHVPHGDPALLGHVPGDLDELLASLLGQLRHRQADDLAVVRRRQAEIGLLDRPLDLLHRR